MAGIFTLATTSGISGARDTAQRLAEGMCLYPWQKPVLVEEPESGVVLGAVVHDGAPCPPEGFCFRDGPVTCVVDGYFIRSLEDCGAEPEIRQGRYAQAAIRAYRKFGSRFAERIEGAFAVLLYDRDRDLLVAGNGHGGNPLLYWYANGREVLYCTQLGPMAGCGFFPAEPDPAAVGCILTDGALNGTDTLIRGVQALEMASTVEHSLADGSRSDHVYWVFGQGRKPEFGKSFDQHLGEVCDVITAAGRRITSRPGRYVSGLSGGLDSRLVTAIAARNRPDLKAWTFGAPDSPDMIVAREICQALDIEHLTWPTKPELVPELAPEYALTVDAAISSDFAYGLERTKGLMQHADIVLNGYAGEVILGDYAMGPLLKVLKTQRESLGARECLSLDKLLGRELTYEQAARILVRKYGQPSALAPHLSHPPRPAVERLVEQIRGLDPMPTTYHVRQHMIMINRGARWTIMGVVSDRHFYSDGGLTYDYELIDRSMAVPQKYLESNRMYAAIFRALTPEVAGIRNANTGLRADAPPVRVNFDKAVRALKRKVNPVRVANPATGNNPDGWARDLYPDHYRRLLADERTRSRPFWDAAAIGGLYEKHLAGEIGIATPLGQLASLEYFFRKWLD